MDDHLTTRRATRRPEGTITALAQSDDPKILTETLHFVTGSGDEFWDMTELVRDTVARSGVRHGQVTVHTPHTTTTLEHRFALATWGDLQQAHAQAMHLHGPSESDCQRRRHALQPLPVEL